LGARRELPRPKQKNTSKGMFHAAGGMAIRRDAEVIESGSWLLLPDWRIDDPFEFGQTIHVLRPTSIRTAHQMQVR